MSGDYTLESSIYILFTTRAFATGIPGTLSASTVAVYENVTATPIETAIAVTESLNSIAGLNAVTIAALAANGYQAGGHYHVVIEAGTVGGVSVVGEVVGHFTIVASAAAEDLANGTDGLGAIKAETALILGDTNELQVDDYPTTIAALQTDLDTLTAGVNVTQFAGGAIPAPAVTGVPDVNVTHVGDTAQTGLNINDILTDTAQIGVAGAGLTNINLPNQTMDIVGNITGNLSGSVGSVTGAVGSVTGAVGSVTGAVGSVTGAVGSVTGHTAQTGDNFAIVNGAAGLVAIDTVVDQILADTGTDGVAIAVGAIAANRFAAGAIDAASLAADAGTEIAAAVWATVIESEGTITAKQAMQINICTLAGATSADGLEFLTPNSVVTRITIGAINATNNRSAVVLNFA